MTRQERHLDRAAARAHRETASDLLDRTDDALLEERIGRWDAIHNVDAAIAMGVEPNDPRVLRVDRLIERFAA